MLLLGGSGSDVERLSGVVVGWEGSEFGSGFDEGIGLSSDSSGRSLLLSDVLEESDFARLGVEVVGVDAGRRVAVEEFGVDVVFKDVSSRSRGIRKTEGGSSESSGD